MVSVSCRSDSLGSWARLRTVHGLAIEEDRDGSLTR